jgi:hypothetical protein
MKTVPFVNIVIKGGNIGFEVLTAVTMKSILFWVVKLCILERVRRFGEHIASLVSCLAYSLILKIEIIFPRSVGLFAKYAAL